MWQGDKKRPGTLALQNPARSGFRGPSRFAPAFGLWLCFVTGALAGSELGPGERTEIYSRATNRFAEAFFYKPNKSTNTDFAFDLAPLLIQEAGAADKASRESFGALTLPHRGLSLDHSRPAIYWAVDSAQISGGVHTRVTYMWCYAIDPSATNHASLPLQGVRITFNSAGQPAVWEILGDTSGAELVFVSQSLERAAAAEFGQPLPGRRYSVERGVDKAPRVVVPRVIDDGPMPMGPIVYLRAASHDVSTLICRCMAAQVEKLLDTRAFELAEAEGREAKMLLEEVRMRTPNHLAFWPGEAETDHRVERCLRLPRTF